MKSLATNETLTTVFTDIGSIIGKDTTGDELIGFSFLVVAVVLDINSSKNFQLKALLVDTEDSEEFDFPIETTKKDITTVLPSAQEYDLDVDANQAFFFELDMAVDAVQLQVRVDTLGATAGIVTSLRYNLGYRQ